MRISVELFGTLARDAGTKKIAVEADKDELTLGELKEIIAQQFPALTPMVRISYVAENKRVAIRNNRCKLNPEAELILIGPVAGG
jgi:molybdopterin converting factor small subunit